MSDKPVIFISYSHMDEPEHLRDGEVQWLSFVRTYLQPAVKHGIFDLWVDRNMPGSADWGPEIEEKLQACDIFILLVSAHSMASDYIIDKEIAIIRERQARGESVYFYPLLLTPTPKAGLDKVQDKNLRPRDAKPFSGYSAHDRAQHMSDAADEIAALVEQVANRKDAGGASATVTQPAYVHITDLPETAYEKLQGRDDQLKRLDDAWHNRSTNILSLIAEGGAGKSALVNEWLRRMQAANYRGAEAVLGWSFYSQGTKERATSAEQFLNWAIEKLGIKIETTSAIAKGEAIAEALAQHRVLLALDGCEPLQHGLDKQQGELKDQGLRALLRRFAAMPPNEAHGLVVLTSRLPVKDIARWKVSAAPVLDIEKLSDRAGAALLRDNGVWGTDKELQAAAGDFGGHPLALGLLASLLKETQLGDVRRRDHIRAWTDDADNSRHDHARRVMESYEKEWFADNNESEASGFLTRLFSRFQYSEKSIMRAIMSSVGLFDRPASGDCLRALRKKPVVRGLTEPIAALDESKWRRAVTRLREVRLLAPLDRSAPDALDAHPLVREWFGEQLKQTNRAAWKAAHGRIYEHLRGTTNEGAVPTLENLAPLYQAIAHGCRAGRYKEALDEIYIERICRRRVDGRIEYYATFRLGAIGSDLAAVSWFFDVPFDIPVSTLTSADQSAMLSDAAFCLRAQGRFSEALPTQRAGLRMAEIAERWLHAAQQASNLSEMELVVGEVPVAIASAAKSVEHADRSGSSFEMMTNRSVHADALHAIGRLAEAEALFADAERRQRESQPTYSLLYSVRGYYYCDLLFRQGDWTTATERAQEISRYGEGQRSLLGEAMDKLLTGRAYLGLSLAVIDGSDRQKARGDVRITLDLLDAAVESLRGAGTIHHIPRGHLARAGLRRSVGDWDGAARDLDEVEEIAEPAPMKLFLCDMALERARLALAKIEAFAPLNGLVEDSPLKPVAPDDMEGKSLKNEATVQLAAAADYIETTGYHKRDEELAELEAVLRGEKKFADLPPRV